MAMISDWNPQIHRLASMVFGASHTTLMYLSRTFIGEVISDPENHELYGATARPFEIR
jgi:hypothetical protein